MAQKSVEKRRERRRRLTLTVAKRRREDHLRRVHSGDAFGVVKVDCLCELADTYFAKRAAIACPCRKRKKGSPRVASGMCNIGERDRIYKWRNEVRNLRIAVRAREDIEEPSREWPRAKHASKPFVVEKRDLDRQGRAHDWWIVRRYRTAAARDNALRALQRNVFRYKDGSPRSEFRAGELSRDVASVPDSVTEAA